MYSYYKKENTYFPEDDCAAVIEMFGGDEERMHLCSLYVNKLGKPFGEKDSLLTDIEYT